MSDNSALWDRIKQPLFVVEEGDKDSLQALRESVRNAGINIHETWIIYLTLEKTKPGVQSFFSHTTPFSIKDISFFGKVKNDEFNKAIRSGFDTLVLIGSVPDKMYRLLTKTGKGLVIGVNQEKYNVDLNVITRDKNIQHIVSYLKETLQKIN